MNQCCFGEGACLLYIPAALGGGKHHLQRFGRILSSQLPVIGGEIGLHTLISLEPAHLEMWVYS